MRERRVARSVGIDRAKLLFEKPPIDLAAEIRQRMIPVGNLVEAGAKQRVGLPLRAITQRR
jgi:hypothetical protein